MRKAKIGHKATRFLFIFAFVGISFLYTNASSAQCPVDTMGSRGALGNGAYVNSMFFSLPDPDELYNFIGPGGCTTMKFGVNPPNLCDVVVDPGVAAVLFVGFAATSHNITGNGCTFNCAGGTCRVRGGDALPVELMEFSVEGTESETFDEKP